MKSHDRGRREFSNAVLRRLENDLLQLHTTFAIRLEQDFQSGGDRGESLGQEALGGWWLKL